MIAWDVHDHLVVLRVLDVDSIADSFPVAVDAANDHQTVIDGRHEGALADQWLERRQINHLPLAGEAGRFIICSLGRQVKELARVVITIASRYIDSALNGASSVHHARPIERWNACSEPLLVVQVEDVHLVSLSSLALHASAARDNDHALSDGAHSEME